MLVLSRKKGESVVIGDNVEFVILDVEGDTVKVGIRAPKDIEIFRKEVYQAIQEANREASKKPISLSQLSKLLPPKPGE